MSSVVSGISVSMDRPNERQNQPKNLLAASVPGGLGQSRTARRAAASRRAEERVLE
jgi:hypothetical protein